MGLRQTWGYATALLDRSRRFGWVDLLFVAGLVGLLYGWFDLATEWTGPHKPQIDIDLDNPWVLVEYTFYSLSRGLIAYVLSLGFTLFYGYWAAKDPRAERLLVPLLDILQSIPVLSFLPGLVLALVGLFPASNVGLELAAVIMIFTGQAWNMTFSFYHSLRSVPKDQQEVATVYHLSWWQRFKWLELPFSTMGLVWNSMMSMAGGWFFLMINEAFRVKGKDFRLPGIGSYMSVAVDQDRPDAMVWAILAMVFMIIALDQLLWRPVVVWAQKFRVEEGGEQPAMSSWFLNLLRRSEVLAALGRVAGWFRRKEKPRPLPTEEDIENAPAPASAGTLASALALLTLVGLLAFGAWKVIELLREVTLPQWGRTVVLGFWTLGRVLVATALGTLWAVPAGLAIGLSPRLSRIMQPVVQILASFPAPMLFPLVVVGLNWAGVSLDWGSILLMLLGTQWYILFNVVAGAMAIPADLREASRSYRMGVWQRFWVLYFPAIFPYLVTGWITAAGGAWNSSIVAEYMEFRGQTVKVAGAAVPVSAAGCAWCARHLSPPLEDQDQELNFPGRVYKAHGLGAQISVATADSEYALLAASTIVMSFMVVVFNRLVWRRCYQLAEEKYSLNK